MNVLLKESRGRLASQLAHLAFVVLVAFGLCEVTLRFLYREPW